MGTTHHLTYFGMEGSGPTVREAKADAGRKIEAALSGRYVPFLIRHGAYLAIIWREPTCGALGYAYKVCDADTGTGSVEGYSSGWTQEEVRGVCAKHLAQLSGSTTGLEQFLSAADIRDAAAYSAWQMRYASARREGQDDAGARQAAGSLCTVA